MDVIRKRMRRLREHADNYDRQNDRILSLIWAGRLRGKTIVTDDLSRAEENRRVLSRTGLAAIHPPSRVLFCKRPTPTDSLMLQTQPASQLLNLPAEIRLQIFEETLKPVGSSGIQLMFACKQIFRESRPTVMRNYIVYEADLPLYTCLRNRRVPTMGQETGLSGYFQ